MLQITYIAVAIVGFVVLAAMSYRIILRMRNGLSKKRRDSKMFNTQQENENVSRDDPEDTEDPEVCEQPFSF